ncbi:hypothetical protein WL14_25585 [Burkholderia cepacia]|nr:hypothetical protein WJ46_07065 [Burkholderia cepacia]KVQ30253.1 hypothetical protein WK02_18085 [Burkholderia cepacia]KVZ20533.1 hypothetical protein WL14_25585 [Burkholderia cepacia]KWA02871.1 hypothetical protein WL26_27055 [Burkholderia cepacia]KWB16816.1 hypothetical protein WL32_29950 [Burkholderia cepacia]
MCEVLSIEAAESRRTGSGKTRGWVDEAAGGDSRQYFSASGFDPILEARLGMAVESSIQSRSHGHFNEPGARYRTDRANFWSLS